MCNVVSIRRPALIFGIILIATLSGCVENRSAAISWNSWVEPELDVISALNAEHTLSVRFMPQYEASYEGPIFAVTGDEYYVGMAAFGSLQEAIIVKVGGNSRKFAIPDPVQWRPASVVNQMNSVAEIPTAKWRHLAVTVDDVDPSAMLVRVFLDGTELTSGAPLLAGAETATGKVLLGRRQRPDSRRQGQFYGFIDDVAVFDRALSAAEIADLGSSRLTGDESALVAGLNFDQYILRSRPSEVRHGHDLIGRAYLVGTDGPDDNAADTARLPRPFTLTLLKLPFGAGETWQVGQGMNNYAGSHKGFAAFTLDMMYVPDGAPRGNYYGRQGPTLDRPVRSAAIGQVVEIERVPSNAVSIRHVGDEYSSYLHLALKSSEVLVDDIVDSGDVVGNAAATGLNSPTAYHLHFGVGDRPDNSTGAKSTIPFGFHDYEVSDDFGVTWRQVDSGRLMPGQWIRH